MIHVLSRPFSEPCEAPHANTSDKQSQSHDIFQHILDYPAPQTRLNSNKLMNLWNQEPMGSWWIPLQELMRQEPIRNRLLIRVKLFLVNSYELSAILLAFLPTCRMRVFLPLSRFSSQYCSIWRFSLALHILLRPVLHTLRCFTGRDEKILFLQFELPSRLYDQQI